MVKRRKIPIGTRVWFMKGKYRQEGIVVFAKEGVYTNETKAELEEGVLYSIKLVKGTMFDNGQGHSIGGLLEYPNRGWNVFEDGVFLMENRAKKDIIDNMNKYV